MVYLPTLKRRTKKTLIFDLDETLIHTNNNKRLKADVYIGMKFPNNPATKAGVNIRKGCREVLLELRKHCEIILFTDAIETATYTAHLILWVLMLWCDGAAG